MQILNHRAVLHVHLVSVHRIHRYGCGIQSQLLLQTLGHTYGQSRKKG